MHPEDPGRAFSPSSQELHYVGQVLPEPVAAEALAVADVLAVAEPLAELLLPLPDFCTVACTIWPALLKTMSTKDFRGEYE